MPRHPRNTAWNVLTKDQHDEVGDDFSKENFEDGSGSRQVVPRTDDTFTLHNSDHPGMVLVTNPLTDTNYLSWKRAMVIALGAKTKLGFVNGSVPRPEPDSPQFEQWKKIDYMLYSWILNSLSRDLVDAFLYADSAQALWEEIEQRYGQSNGPLLFQLQKEIATVQQGTNTVAAYFTKLKRLWDEYASLVPLPPCTCGSSKLLADLDTNTKLMQFLMGLNDSYENVRSQILLIDPLPNVNRAYSMIQRVERQRTVQNQFPDTMNNAAMFTRAPSGGRGGMSRGGHSSTPWTGGRGRGYNRLSKEDKAKLLCEHCQEHGHLMQNCFKLHGYPDWYKTFREQQKLKGFGRSAANMVDTVDDKQELNREVRRDASLADISNLIRQEFTKLMGAKTQSGLQASGEELVNHAHFTDSAGIMLSHATHYALTSIESIDAGSWILDSDASRHMCAYPNQMTNIVHLAKPISILLPDGTTTSVTETGFVKLTDTLILNDVLLVPKFKYNLLSVAQLIQQSNLKCVFLPSSYILRDLGTNQSSRQEFKLILPEILRAPVEAPLRLIHSGSIRFKSKVKALLVERRKSVVHIFEA
ncbi:hypothetical protein DH2020_007674 [Rehmannia glutinosa]|uniref:Retrotransposon Copia-like N-terminal domain-containing protein n=1 Tax=Rehmannia glutinosa TaxID=99300 RepID=A0ABR0TZU5_REHGL